MTISSFFILNFTRKANNKHTDYHTRHTTKKAFKNNLEGFSAVRTRLELVTSCVTGRHSNQLN